MPRRNWDKWAREPIRVLACVHCGRLSVPYFGIPGPCLPGHTHSAETTIVHRSELAWELARAYLGASNSEKDAFRRYASREDIQLLERGLKQLQEETVTRR